LGSPKGITVIPFAEIGPPWFIAVKTTVVHTLAMSREAPQFKLRMPDELKQVIEESAKENGRSMNAEIVSRLEQSQDAPRLHLTDQQARAIAAEILEKLETPANPSVLLPDDLAAVGTFAEMQEVLIVRRLMEDEALQRIIRATNEKAHAVYEAQGLSEQYLALQRHLSLLRKLETLMLGWLADLNEDQRRLASEIEDVSSEEDKRTARK